MDEKQPGTPVTPPWEGPDEFAGPRELILPDPAVVTLARLRETVAPAAEQARQMIARMADRDEGAAAADELRRRLEAFRRYLQDKQGRDLIAAECRRTEVLIGKLLGPPETGGDRRSEDFKSPAGDLKSELHKDDRHKFRLLAEHEEAVERLLAEGTVSRNSILERIKRPAPAAEPAEPLIVTGERFRIDQADALDWLASLPADSVDLIFGSPPYEDARLYLEGGRNVGIARDTEQWVAWMVRIVEASLRACKGLVAFVVAGRTTDYRWSASPALLMADLTRKGVHLRCPPLYHRVGIPGSGGPDWLRNDYEFIVCAARGGPLPWSDNVAMGDAPKYAPGGDPSHRRVDGSRANRNVNGDGYATTEERGHAGPHRVRQRAGHGYVPPEKANPGNVIRCKVGGGNMGDALCHENEAPFPEYLAEFFVRSFCPPGGVVADCFTGSGTTGKMALAFGRRFLGCDLRASQVELTRKRLSSVQQHLQEA